MIAVPMHEPGRQLGRRAIAAIKAVRATRRDRDMASVHRFDAALDAMARAVKR